MLTPEQRLGSPDTYVGHMLHVEPDGSFSIVALVWRPGQITRIHDHITWCVLGVIQGTEHEELFDADLNLIGESDNHVGDVSGFAPAGDIHRVHNTADETAISIHVYERVRARRGAQVAAVATARKLASLFWAVLTRKQDYAYGQPSLARHKIRRLELAAGAPSRKGQVRPGDGARNPTIRDAERALAQQAENAYRRTIADWTSPDPAERARARHRGAHLTGPRRARPRGRPHAPDACASLRRSPVLTNTLPQEPPPHQPLTSSVRESPGPGVGVRRGR